MKTFPSAIRLLTAAGLLAIVSGLTGCPDEGAATPGATTETDGGSPDALPKDATSYTLPGSDIVVDVPQPDFECSVEPPAIIEPVWIAGGNGKRSELGKFGKPDALFLDDQGILLAGDEHEDFEEVHLYDIKTDNPNKNADFIEPLVDWGANPGPAGKGPLEFFGVSGFAKDPLTGRIFIAEQGNGRIQIIKPAADPSKPPYYVFDSFFGSFAADKDHPKDGEFVRMQAVRIDSLRRLFVSDDARDNAETARRDIQVFSPELKFLFKLGDSSYGPLGKDGNVKEPENFVIDEARDRLYLCDESTNEVVVYRYSDRSFIKRFSGFIGVPNGVDIDQYGFLYAVDEGNEDEGSFVRVFDPDTLLEIYHFGTYSDKDDLTPGAFRSPDTLLIHKGFDLLLVADQGHDRIQAFRLSEIQQRACIAGLRVTSPSRALKGKSLTVRAELLRRDGQWDRGSFRVTADIEARDGTGKAIAVTPKKLTLHNGMGAATVALETAGPVTLTVKVGAIEGTHTVEVLEAPAERALTGALAGANLSWGPDDGVIRITGAVEVPEGKTLTIAPGTLVMLDEYARIDTYGHVDAQGTDEEPIAFFPVDRDKGWGQVESHGASADVVYTNVFFTGGAHVADPRAFANTRHCCIPMLHVHGGRFLMTRSVIADSEGKGLLAIAADLEIKGSYLGQLEMGAEIDCNRALLEDNFVVEMRGKDDNDGIYIWGFDAYGLADQTRQEHWVGKTREDEDVKVVRTVVADGDDDGIDTRGSSPLFEGCLMYGWADKGVSLTNGKPHIQDTLIFGNAIGIKVDNFNRPKAWFDLHPPPLTFGPTLDHVTIADHSKWGLWISDRNGTDADADVQPTLTGVIIWDVPKAIETDFDPAKITVNKSILSDTIGTSGAGNVTDDPHFLAPAEDDYRTNPLSPAVELGTPDAPAGWSGFSK